MKRMANILSLIISIALVGFLLMPVDAVAKCSGYYRIRNVSINDISGPFPIVNLAPGQQVTIDLDFSLANREGCLACIRQIVVGIDDTPIDCVYHGIPRVCRNGETNGSGTVSFAAPTSPGLYIIYALNMAQYTCMGAMALYPKYYEHARAICAIEIKPPEECPASCRVYNVSINNVSIPFPIVNVSPGQEITVDMDFSLANREGCPACIRQIVVGIDDTSIDCVYNGIPRVCTNGETNGSGTVSFVAPSSPGVYVIYAHDMAQYTCMDAMALYPEKSYAYAGMIGAIEIIPSQPECPGDFDRDGDVDSSDLSVFSSDFGRTDCFTTGP